MGVCGCLSSTVSFILVCITVSQLKETGTKFVDKMDILQGNYTQVLKVKHEDFNGLVYLLHTDEYAGTERQRESWTTDIPAGLDYLSLNYMDFGPVMEPADFARNRPIFFGFTAFTCVFTAFTYICVSSFPSNNKDAPPYVVSIIQTLYKAVIMTSEYQVMMIYLCAEAEKGELIMFAVPGDALILQFFINLGLMCCYLCSAADENLMIACSWCMVCIMCVYLMIFTVPLFATLFNFIPNFVNTMKSSDYSDHVIFDDEYYDTTWLAYELLGSSVILDAASIWIDPCIDWALNELCGMQIAV